MKLTSVLFVLVIISALATAGALFAGLIVMARAPTEDPARMKTSNKLMWWRVRLQMLTLGLLLLWYPRRPRLTMVTLTRIYTKGGDKGLTSLGRGERVAKHDLRVEAYGTVDEANSAIGIVRAVIARTVKKDRPRGHVDAMLARIQNDLFDLGADLCTMMGKTRKGQTALRIVPSQTERLEHEIDAMNAELAPLTSFILPGGTEAAAHLHLARTVARRAERCMTALAVRQAVNPEAIKYINRLSDHLFVLGRRLNGNGAADVLWVPGGSR